MSTPYLLVLISSKSFQFLQISTDSLVDYGDVGVAGDARTHCSTLGSKIEGSNQLMNNFTKSFLNNFIITEIGRIPADSASYLRMTPFFHFSFMNHGNSILFLSLFLFLFLRAIEGKNVPTS